MWIEGGDSGSMSGVILKNLPKLCLEEDLKKFLSDGGLYVDSVRIPRDSNEENIGTGFIDNLTSEECRAVIRYLQGTHFGGWLIRAELAVPMIRKSMGRRKGRGYRGEGYRYVPIKVAGSRWDELPHGCTGG